MLVLCYKLYLVQAAFCMCFIVLRIMMFLDLVHCLVAMDKILKPVIVSVIYIH